MKLVQGISFLLFCFLLPCSAEQFKQSPKRITDIILTTGRIFPLVDKKMASLIIALETGMTYKAHISPIETDGTSSYGITQCKKETKKWMQDYYNLPDGKLMNDRYSILIMFAYLNILKQHYKFSDGDIVRAYGSGVGRTLEWKCKHWKGSLYLKKYQYYEKLYNKGRK